MRYQFVIPGEPGSKGRPRFSNRGKYVSVHTPPKTVEYENLVRLSFMEQCGTPSMLEGSLEVKIFAYFSPPKNVSKVKLNKMLANEMQPQKKPDSDNIAKVVLDSLNKVAFEDDKQVSDLHVFKRYAQKPCVMVVINEIEPEEE